MSGFLLLSFVAGVLTVLAPCILPLLPVIVGGALTENSVRRVGVIVVSLGASILFFTLLLKATTAFIAIPALVWQILSGSLIVFFGIVTLFPSVWDHVPGVTSLYQGSNKMLGAGYQRKGFLGEMVMGAALGPVFSSCSPTYFLILAAVLPASLATGVLYLLAYVAGLCLFLFVIAVLGQRAVLWLGVAANSSGRFKKVIGILFILIGAAILFGWDKKLEAILPAGSYFEVALEQSLLSGNSSARQQATSTPPTSSLTLTQKSLIYPKAPELVAPDGYINTDGKPITLAELRGKVVLVDFWDYSCINCQRTFPYLKAWYEKYKDQGLVIVGVHTPEFAFEQLQSNVQAAADRFGLTYPIVLDNQYQTWRAYQNQYWPREYLIDIDGFIVYDHAGEGEYDVTERAIQQALAERAARLGMETMATSTVSVAGPDFSAIKSPETYFGFQRNKNLGNGTPGIAGTQTFLLPATVQPNRLYLVGVWNIMSEYARGSAGASIVFSYSARDVYIVATNPESRVEIQVWRDGKPVGAAAGDDVDPNTSTAVIEGDRLYKLIHDDSPGAHTIKIEIKSGTLDAYTFTFG